MARFLIFVNFACALLYASAFAAPVESLHQSGGVEHIVIIDKDHPASPEVEEVMQRIALHPSHPDVIRVYNNTAFRGFSASMQSHCVDLLTNMTDLSVVEKASIVSRTDSSDTSSSAPYYTRPNAPWGLERISVDAVIIGVTSQTDFTYSYADKDLGKGADIYIVDTGIYTKNEQFSNRASMLWSFDGSLDDDMGHGTHVAGIAAGDTFGVASNANIIGVKALGPEGGWTSSVVAAIDVVILNHIKRQSQSNFVGSVMSISLNTGGPADAITAAIAAAVSVGIHTCVAAGNSAEDACKTIPASSGGIGGSAITVGSIDPYDLLSSFSNYGDCVDVYAPGVEITSAWIGAPNANKTLDGTSMAAPHVTGLIAYGMSNRTLAGSPDLMKYWVHSRSYEMMNGNKSFLLANNGIPFPTSSSPAIAPPRIGWNTPTSRVDQNDSVSSASSRKREAKPVRSIMGKLFSLVETSARLQGEG